MFENDVQLVNSTPNLSLQFDQGRTLKMSIPQTNVSGYLCVYGTCLNGEISYV